MLTVPKYSLPEDALPWLIEQRDYILEARTNAKPVIIPEFGTKFPLEGNLFWLAKSNTEFAWRDGETLYLPGTNEELPLVLAAYCKQIAGTQARKLADDYCRELQVAYSRITLRDPRTRWGSCSTAGSLSFSWRLMMAPPEVFGYVVAHEVAHLKAMNHSVSFWEAVEKICPNYEQYRLWLTTNGGELFRFKLG